MSGDCQRCVRAERRCTYAPRQERKPRRRTDARVAELEREVRAMRAVLKDRSNIDSDSTPRAIPQTIAREANGSAESSPSTGTPKTTSKQRSTSAGGLPSDIQTSQWSSPSLYTMSSHPEVPLDYWSPSASLPMLDVIDRGLLPASDAQQLVQIYCRDLYPLYPMIFVSEETVFQEFRQSKPNLFLAVVAAAASKVDPHLYSILTTEVLQTYATRIVVNSEKSLELVQAMTITAAWHFPPDSYSRLKFYEYIHMASTMCIDLDLGSNTSESASGSELNVDRKSRDSCRALLASYVNCSSVAISLRRPNMLRFNANVENCARILKESPIESKYDPILSAWVHLNHIGEQIAVAFSYDDPSSGFSLDANRSDLMIKGFRKELNVWESSQDMKRLPGTSPDLSSGSLQMMFYVIKIILHEIVLYRDHPPTDFKAPNPAQSLRVVRNTKYPIPSSDSLMTLVSAAQAIWRIFAQFSPDAIRALSGAIVVRFRYAVYVLCKIFASTRDPTSELGQLVDPDSLNLTNLFDTALKQLRAAAAPVGFRVPSVFLMITEGYQNWYNEQIGQTGIDSTMSNEPAQSYMRQVLDAQVQISEQDHIGPMVDAATNSQLELLYGNFEGDMDFVQYEDFGQSGADELLQGFEWTLNSM
ncbi:MAG: hypothetical protein M1820_007530 [Bogoriella megaspora]|nr:MAG: hypothetical protein M1820_007530 [Bogoriella megaspora]